MFIAALTVALLALWSFEATRHWSVAALAAAAYATSLEVFVRSSYGGYFGITNFAIVLMLCVSSVCLWRCGRVRWRAAFGTGLFAALADHKLLFLPFAFAFWELVKPRSGAIVERLRRSITFPTALGFAAGTALFWIHGLSTHPIVFWHDHLRNHLIDRLISTSTRYPPITILWQEISWHTGYVLMPVGLVLLVAIVMGSSSAKPAENETHAPQPTGAWLIWLVATAAAFSFIDWRMTKHLMPMLPALYLAPALWVDTAPPGCGRWSGSIGISSFIMSTGS